MKGKLVINNRTEKVFITNICSHGYEKLDYLWIGTEEEYIGDISSLTELKRLRKWIDTIIKVRSK